MAAMLFIQNLLSTQDVGKNQVSSRIRQMLTSFSQDKAKVAPSSPAQSARFIVHVYCTDFIALRDIVCDRDSLHRRSFLVAYEQNQHLVKWL